MKKQLIKYCYRHQKEYVYDVGQMEFDCLIAFIKEGCISSYEELADYGMKY